MPEMFTTFEKQVMAFLSILVVEHPGEIKALLSVYDIYAKTEKEMIDAIYQKIEEKDSDFKSDLAQLIHLYYQPFTSDHFTGSAPVPTDPISAIAGAIGSMGNMFSQSLKNKNYKQEARTQTFRDVLAYQSLKQQLAAEQMIKERVNRNRRIGLQIVVVTVLSGIGGWYLLKK